MVDVNVNGTKNIVELCLRHDVKKLVHTSSVHAIPEKSHGETITEVSEFDPDRYTVCMPKQKLPPLKLY